MEKISSIKKRNNLNFKGFKRTISANNAILIIIFYLLFFIVISNGNKNLFRYERENIGKLGLNLASEITIILKETIGYNNILYCSFYKLPDEVFLNDIKIGEKNCTIYLKNQNNNTIKIKWKNNLGSCNRMFYSMSNIIEMDLSNFDTSTVTDMYSMFYGCYSLNSLNLSSFNTSLVTDMSFMLYNCSSLKNLDLSNFNTSLVKNMHYMFGNCRLLKSLDLSSFNTSLVVDMSDMFVSCRKLEFLDLSNFDTSLVTDMENMFAVCHELISLNISNFNTSSVKYMRWMFGELYSLKFLNLSNFNTSLVETMYCMFYNDYLLEFLDISNFDTSFVKAFEDMFSDCYRLTTLDLSNFNTSEVKYMNFMFFGCGSLESLNLSNFDTSLVITMEYMFCGCSKLKYLDISNFNTSLVKDMNSMFVSCCLLKSLDLSNFQTTLVANMRRMFYNSYSLKYLDLSNFDTSSVTDMELMFRDCRSLEFLNITNFNTSLVINMGYMFYNCHSLISLNISNFDTNSVTNMNYMFYGCRNLIYLNLQNFQEIQDLVISNILNKTRENIIYCINEASSPEIHKLFTDKLCSKKDCSINWSKNNEILIKYSCNSNCHKDLYLFQYNNKCYEKCPIGTHPINYTCSENSLTTFITEIGTNIKTNIDDNINTDTNANTHTNIKISTNINDIIFTNNFSNLDTKINTYITTDIEGDIYTNTQTNNNVSINTDINTNINTDINTNININDNTDNNSYLFLCNVSIINIYDIKIDNETIKKHFNNYINKSIDRNVYYFIDKNKNLSITLFKDWVCTEELLKNGFFKLNTSKIDNKIKNLNNFEYFIYIYINYNYNNYFEIYDTKDRKRLIDLENIFNLNENNLKIINNFTEEISDYFSKVIIDKINEYNIDIFDKNFYIFNDLCKNFTIQNIDIPLKERRQILFLGNIQKEIICNDINCDIGSMPMNKFIGECNCKIETFINNLISKYEQYKSFINKEYINYINSKTKINSLLILKCGKESFKLANLKNNIIFYISIIFISVYILIFLVYYICSKNNSYKIYKNIQLNPPKIQKFDISDDFEDNEEEEQNKVNSKENKNENKIIVQMENNNKEIQNGEKKSIDFLILNTEKKKYKHSIKNNKRNNKLPPINYTNAKQDKIIEKEKVIKFKKNINNKNNFNDLNQKTEENYLNSKDYNTDSNNKEIVNKKNSDIKVFYILDTNENFLYYYWKLLSLKQPIINLFTSIEFLKTGESYIPLPIKIIRILFYLLTNIFFNSLHLDQQYFRKKFHYFEKKYNIIDIYPEKIISLNERFIYAFNHSIISGVICFIICFIIQSLLNYFFFNSKNDILKLKNISNNNNRKILNLLNEYYKKYFLIVFSIKFIALIFICYSIINFTQVYTGGITDLIAGTIWTLIFLQIFPFIYCIIFAFIFKMKNKNKKSNLLNFWGFIYF